MYSTISQHAPDVEEKPTSAHKLPILERAQLLQHFQQLNPIEEDERTAELKQLGYEFRYAEKAEKLLAESREAVWGLMRKDKISPQDKHSQHKDVMTAYLHRRADLISQKIQRLIDPGEGWQVYFSERIQAFMIWQLIQEGNQPGFLF